MSEPIDIARKHVMSLLWPCSHEQQVAAIKAAIDEATAELRERLNELNKRLALVEPLADQSYELRERLDLHDHEWKQLRDHMECDGSDLPQLFAAWDALKERLGKSDAEIKQDAQDWAETDTAIREALRPSGIDVDGDSNSVPPVEELARLVADKLAKSEEANASGLKMVKLALAEQEQRNQDLLGIRNELQRRLTESEAANAAMRIELDKIACWQEGEVVDGSFDEPSSAAIARHALALSTDAGRDYVPKQQVEEAWRKGMTDAAILVESLIESDLTESRNPINVCRQIHKDLILIRDAEKESA